MSGTPGSGSGRVTLAPITAAEAEATATWRYPAELSIYDGDDATVADMLVPANRFYGIHLGGDFVGYVCVGAEARVPGLGAAPGVDDLGIGLAPARVGQGLSRSLLPAVIAALGELGALRGHTLRAVVLDWNERSLAATAAAGFHRSGIHVHESRTFIVLTRPRH